MDNFPIVCVGGSAGGLDAYIRLLKNLPPDRGVAVVIVNHIKTLPTQLHEVLPRFSTMPVELISERLQIAQAIVRMVGTQAWDMGIRYHRCDTQPD